MVKNHIPWAIKLEHFPEQAGTLTFNGYTQSVIWRYFNPEELKIVGGSTSAVNANTYYTDFKPTAKFVFPNGTKKIYRASWKIDKLKLTKPTVSGGNNQTYDKNAKALSFSGFDSDWETISNNSRTVSGSQTVTIALKDKNNTTWADGSTADLTFTLTVNKRVLTKPTISGANEFVEDGNAHSLNFSNLDTNWEIVTGNSATAVGEQTVTISLVDKNNTQWADGSTTDLNFTLTVVSSEPEIYISNDVCTLAIGAAYHWITVMDAEPDLAVFDEIDSSGAHRAKTYKKVKFTGKAELATCVGWNDDSITYEGSSGDTESDKISNGPSTMQHFKYAKLIYSTFTITKDTDGIVHILYFEKGGVKYKILCRATYDG